MSRARTGERHAQHAHASPDLHLPIRHEHDGKRRIVVFSGAEEKAAWLDAAASLDASDPWTQRFVATLLRGAPRDPRAVA
jgi:hypothetical protein